MLTSCATYFPEINIVTPNIRDLKFGNLTYERKFCFRSQHYCHCLLKNLNLIFYSKHCKKQLYEFVRISLPYKLSHFSLYFRIVSTGQLVNMSTCLIHCFSSLITLFFHLKIEFYVIHVTVFYIKLFLKIFARKTQTLKQ